MGLKKTSELLSHAQQGGYAVGYFEAWDMYSFEAVLEAAEEENSPVVLGFGGKMMEQQWLNRFGIAPFGAYGKVIAENAKVPVSFILNEELEIDQVAEGVKSGFNTAMLDRCDLPYDEYVAITRRVVELAKPHNVEVEAELGLLPNFGEEGESSMTDPKEAQDFVKATGIDFLAISVGNVHLQTEGTSAVDVDRIKELREAVDTPLVLHGGTGYPPDMVRAAIDNGVNFFHYGTLMKKEFFEVARTTLNSIGLDNVDYQAVVGSRKVTDMLGPAKERVKEIVKKHMKIYGCSGKA